MARVITENGQVILRSDWHIEDVLGQAENMGIELTNEQAAEVLGIVADCHDANIGINWEVIDAAIDYFLETNK